MATLTEYLLSQFSFPSYIIELGVLAGGKERKEKVQIGVTNAQIMYIQENGSPLQNIPARPVLQMTIDWITESKLIDKMLDKLVDVYMETKSLKAVDRAMDKFCMQIQKYARKLIYNKDPRLTPNSPVTIAKKGSDTPLFDTGQLARSITCRAIRIDKGG